MPEISELVRRSVPQSPEVDLGKIHARARRMQQGQRDRARAVYAGTAVALVVVVMAVITQLPADDPQADVAMGGQPEATHPLSGISGPAAQGEGTMSLADFAGRPLIVYVWSEWCGECMRTGGLATMQALSLRSDDQVQVVGILVASDADRARQLMVETDTDFPTIRLDNPTILTPALLAHDILTQEVLGRDRQATVAVNADGDVVRTLIGEFPPELLDRFIDSATTATEPNPHATVNTAGTPDPTLPLATPTPQPTDPNDPPPTASDQVGCYSGPADAEPSVTIVPTDGLAYQRVCAELWADGVVGAGPVPGTFITCRHAGGGVSVLPGSAGDCATNDMTPVAVISAIDGPRVPRDLIKGAPFPRDVVDIDTVVLLGDDGDHAVYLARWREDPQGLCLLVRPTAADDAGFAVACDHLDGIAQQGLTMAQSRGTEAIVYGVVPDGHSQTVDLDIVTLLSENAFRVDVTSPSFDGTVHMGGPLGTINVAVPAGPPPSEPNDPPSGTDAPMTE